MDKTICCCCLSQVSKLNLFFYVLLTAMPKDRGALMPRCPPPTVFELYYHHNTTSTPTNTCHLAALHLTKGFVSGSPVLFTHFDVICFGNGTVCNTRPALMVPLTRGRHWVYKANWWGSTGSVRLNSMCGSRTYCLLSINLFSCLHYLNVYL